MRPVLRSFLRLVFKFDLATSIFRSFEVSAIQGSMQSLEFSGRILDIGCAEGTIGRMVFSGATNIFGLDYEKDYLLKAGKNGIYAGLIAADAAQMPFKGGSFGFLFSNSVLEHIPDLGAVFTEARRVLKPGGMFLITVPNDNFSDSLFFFRFLRLFGLKSMAVKYSGVRNRRLNHFHLYPGSQWSKSIHEAGFKEICIKSYISPGILMLWDLVAAVQFTAKKTFDVFLKIPIMKDIIAASAYCIKIIAALCLLPIFLIMPLDAKKGCASLVLAKKL